MKFLKGFLKWFLISLTTIVLLMYVFDVDYLLRAVKTIYFKGHTTAFLEDYKEFPNREIKKGIAQPWSIAKDYNSIPASETLEKTHKDLQTVAYLIIQNDSVVHESYFDNYTKDSKSNSFSMAKSVVTMALGKAIMQGKINNLDQKVSDFFPELKGKLNGHAVRVPLANASLTDCVFEIERPTTIEAVNRLFKEAANNELEGILGYEERPLVSVDYKSDPRSSIVDALSTMVVNHTQVKLYLWYDNEWGYANRTAELVRLVGLLDKA